MNKIQRVYFWINIYGNLVCHKVGISDWKEKDELFNKRCWDTCLVIWKNKAESLSNNSCKNNSRGQK